MNLINTYLKNLTMFIDFRKRGEGGKRERERERKKINVTEKHRLVAFHMLTDWGSNPHPRYVP